MTTRRLILTLLGAVAIVVIIVSFLSRRKIAQQVAPIAAAPKREIPPIRHPADPQEDGAIRNRAIAAAAVTAAYDTPINFYGQVVDEARIPVANANAKASAADRPWAEKNAYSYATTDANGRFSFENLKGIELSVWVEKAGYYAIQQSKATFTYAGQMSPENVSRLPTPATPAVFVLKKGGAPAVLNHLPRRAYPISKKGEPKEIDLITGEAVALGKGHLRVEAWTEDEVKDASGRYRWRCRLSVPQGGVAERSDRFQFQAPEDGYTHLIELGMDQSSAVWDDDIRSEYFLRLADGRFARIAFRMLTAGDHFFAIEAFLNPQPGDRNLEYVSNRVDSTKR